MNTRFSTPWRLLALGLLVAVLLAAGSALAGPAGTAADWWVIAAGGGPVSGGSVTLDSTLGQPLAGASSGGTVTLGAGYWYSAGRTWSLYLPVALRIAAP